MAATIQTIQKPTRARALDTSTSIQESKEMITDGSFPDSTNWELGDDWTIGSNKATCTNDAGDSNGNLKQNHFSGSYVKGYGDQEHYEHGATYRCTYTISDYDDHSSGTNGIRLLLYSNTYSDYGNGTERVWVGISSNITANGTNLTQDITINHNAGSSENLLLAQTNGDPLTISISNLSIRKLESFGNNNHGQIYSGRALEFDGVSDYLNMGEKKTLVDYSAETTQANRAWTVACWININDYSGIGAIIGGGYGVSSTYFCVGSDGKLGVWDVVGGGTPAWRTGDKVVETGVWYRAVVVFDGDVNVTFYLNGVQDGNSGVIDAADDNADLVFEYIGRRSDSSHRLWDGKLSDLQLWQGAWTADDVLYDYNNPEQLALNRGGTLLTNSNLKAWYPMNDGHRGQQSYILDASNTGLGDNVVVNGSFDADSDWTKGSGWSISDGKAIFSGSAFASLTPSSAPLISGKVYKIILDATVTNGSFKLQHNSVDIITESTSGSYTAYINSAATTFNIARASVGVQNDFTIDNIVIKPINDKNHATTVFYGDNLIPGVSGAAEGDFEDSGNTPTFAATYAGGSGSGITYDADNTSSPLTGSKDGKVTNAAGENAGVISNGITLVTGRTYKVGFNYLTNYDASSQTNKLRFKIGETQAHDSTNIDTAGGYAGEDNLTATSKTAYSQTFVHTDSDTEVFIVLFGGNGLVFQFDDIYIKEIGTASGWTDADQQLDIPQTALQSFNQLAWFDGVSSHIDITQHADFEFGDGSDDTPFSVSAWVYMNDISDGFPIVSKYQSNSVREWNFRVNHSDQDLNFFTYDESANAYIGRKYEGATMASYVGKWVHLVGTYSGNEENSGFSLYINGEAVDDDNFSGGSYTAMENNLDGKVYIGKDGSNSKFANGAVTEVSIWGTALSQAEINELYNDGKAIDCLQHSQYISDPSELVAYWRNNGITKWVNLKNPGTHDGSISGLKETMLITPGVDGSRDSQGFIMNRQRTTNSLNFYTPLYLETDSAALKESPFVFLPKAPLMTDSTAVTNFSICAWVKYNRTPDQANAQSVIYDDVQEEDTGTNKGLKLSIDSANVLTCEVWWGFDNDTVTPEIDMIYSTYGLDNLENATITNPHSFGTDGMWNGTQTSMDLNKGIGYSADDMLSGKFPPDKWFHIAVTFDHDNAEGGVDETSNPDQTGGSPTATAEAPFYTYINGILVAKNGRDKNDTLAVADNFDKSMVGTADHAAIIGSDMQMNQAYPGNNKSDTHGEIDELLMYSDTLTSKEVLRIYNAGKRSHK